MKATPEVVMQREVARAAWTLTNFLRWMRREFTPKPIDQAALDERVQARILPHVQTIGGMCAFVERNQTPLRVWRKALGYAQ